MKPIQLTWFVILVLIASCTKQDVKNDQETNNSQKLLKRVVYETKYTWVGEDIHHFDTVDLVYNGNKPISMVHKKGYSQATRYDYSYNYEMRYQFEYSKELVTRMSSKEYAFNKSALNEPIALVSEEMVDIEYTDDHMSKYSHKQIVYGSVQQINDGKPPIETFASHPVYYNIEKSSYQTVVWDTELNFEIWLDQDGDPIRTSIWDEDKWRGFNETEYSYHLNNKGPMYNANTSFFQIDCILNSGFFGRWNFFKKSIAIQASPQGSVEYLYNEEGYVTQTKLKDSSDEYIAYYTYE